MGKLWNIIKDWRDGMAYPPSERQIARSLHASPSALKTWKNPEKMPEPRSLAAIAEVTATPFHRVVQAAIDDVGLFDEKAATEAWVAWKKRGLTVGDGVDISSDPPGTEGTDPQPPPDRR